MSILSRFIKGSRQSLVGAVAIVSLLTSMALSFDLALSAVPASAYGGADGASVQMDRANRAYLSRRYQEAVGILSRVLVNDPSNDAAHNLLGKSYHRLGKLQEAMDQYQLALKSSNSSEYRFNYGVALFDDNKFADAKTQFEEALKR